MNYSCNRNMSGSYQSSRYSQMQRNQYGRCRTCKDEPEHEDHYVETPSSPCSSDCLPQNEHIDKMEVAMAYVPWQPWGEILDYDTALKKGTIFSDLVKPWLGRCMCNV